MKYKVKNYEHLFGMNGFSKELLQNHFTLYQGYVNNTNTLYDTTIACIKEGKSNTREHLALRKLFGWEFNGMKLHELYFENMTKNVTKYDRNSPFHKKITEEFGSFENWEKDFRTVGAMRGIGWTVLYYDPTADCLLTTWINEHDTGNLSGAYPILIMDVFEHAFMVDYGLKRAEYIDAFFNSIDWNVVCHRYETALKCRELEPVKSCK